MKGLLNISLLFFVGLWALNAQPTNPTDAKLEYIRKYKDDAAKEMARSGIPASITLAQGILESASGTSTLAQEANNHFGIKCGANWSGKTYYREDDDRDASGNLIKSCFRKYNKVEDSYDDHADFLTDPRKAARYGFLFNLPRTDYRSWAYGLQSAGYATNPNYGNMLIGIIEQYRLFDYDTEKATDIADKPPVSAPGTKIDRSEIGRINDVKVVYTSGNETLEDIARKYGIRTSLVDCYNECYYPKGVKLPASSRVFIQHKRKKWRGRDNEHIVRDNETMFDIAQQYGIRLLNLYEKNNMPGGSEPAVGETLRLRGFALKAKNIQLRSTTPIKPTVTPTPPPATNQGNPTKPTLPDTSNPGTSRPPSTPSTNPSTSQPTYKPTSEELFEIGDGNVSGGSTKPPTTTTTIPPPVANPQVPIKPATTGTPVPNIPPPVATQPSQPTSTVPPPSGGGAQPLPPGSVHIVIKGDTLYNISKRYNLTVEKLKQLNGLTENTISIGQQLRIK